MTVCPAIDFPQRLRWLLDECNVTGVELARRLDKRPMWVSDRLRGHSQITAADLLQISWALAVEPVDFFDPDIY